MFRRNPIIIVEGPDAVGKTTLANEMRQRHGARYIHLSYARDLVRLWRASIDRALRLSEQAPVVIDRHWPSEAVYAKVYRGGSLLETEAIVCDLFLQTLGVVYVSCALDTVEMMVEAHAKSSGERPEMYEADERIAQVAQGYLDWRARLGNREDVLDYNYTKKHLPCHSMAILAISHGHVLLEHSHAPREIENPRQFVLENL